MEPTEAAQPKRPRRRWLRRIGLSLLVGVLLLAGFLTFQGLRIMNMPGHSYTGPLPALNNEEIDLRDRLRQHVTKLAVEIGERNVDRLDRYQAVAHYITQTFERCGYRVRQLQPSSYNGIQISNLEVELPGKTHPDQIIVIGAHYDTVRDCPGADDNASAVAGLLEIARMMRQSTPDRTVRFVAFYNEEDLATPTGSFVYAQSCKRRGDNIVGMVSLEMLGYYSDAADSQHYPAPFSLFYPSTGNFIGFVGNSDSRRFIHDSIWSFRQHAKFPSKGIAAPSFIPDAGRSDHGCFWRFGYPGLMVTDTANFRNPHYHQPTDTIETIDFDRFARVTVGIARVVEDLSKAR